MPHTTVRAECHRIGIADDLWRITLIFANRRSRSRSIICPNFLHNPGSFGVEVSKGAGTEGGPKDGGKKIRGEGNLASFSICFSRGLFEFNKT